MQLFSRWILKFVVIVGWFGMGSVDTLADWSQLRGPNRDGVSQETGLLKSWSKKGPKVLWKTRLGEGFSGVSVSDGRVFSMFSEKEDEFVVCLNAVTGEEIWRFRSDDKYRESEGGNGPRSTPAVLGDRVFALSAFGRFCALDVKTGALIWDIDFQQAFNSAFPQWGFSTSPMVMDSLIVVEVGGGGVEENLVAFDGRTGKVKWMGHTDKAAYSSPILVNMFGERQIIHFSANEVAGISADIGLPLWHYKWDTPYDVHVAVPVFVSPDKVYISSGYGVGAGLIKIRQEGQKQKIEEVWKNRRLENKISTSVYVDGYLYGFHNSILKCTEAETGKERWKKRGYGAGSLIVADGHLIILGDSGKLGLVEITPESYVEKGNTRVFRGKCWTAPSLANGKLYVRNERDLVCLDLQSSEE